MKIEATENRIEGLCDAFGDGRLQSVITLTKRHGKWTVASSMALPVDIVRAVKILDCYQEALSTIGEVEGQF